MSDTVIRMNTVLDLVSQIQFIMSSVIGDFSDQVEKSDVLDHKELSFIMNVGEAVVNLEMKSLALLKLLETQRTEAETED